MAVQKRGYSMKRSRGLASTALSLFKTAGRVTRAYKRRRTVSRVGGRRRVVSRVRVNRRRRGYVPSNNEELAQSSRTLGRKLRFTNKFTRKYVKKQTELQKYRMGQISAYGGTSGPLIFPNWQTGSGTTKLAPCTMFDLSGCYNIDGGSSIAPQTTWNINFTNDTGAGVVEWVPASAGWQLAPLDVSSSTAAAGSFVPKKNDYLKWVKMKFLFYTPTTIPTKISVQLVQFKDARLLPTSTRFGAVTEQPPAAVSSYVTSFWQNYLKGYMFNPISPSSGIDMSRCIKVLHSDTFILNPKDNDEPVNTRYKIHQIFKNFNRYQNYCPPDQNFDTINLDAMDLPNRLGDNDVTVHPRARVYLIIRALAAEQQSATYPPANWQTLWPSADVYIETCHMNTN